MRCRLRCSDDSGIVLVVVLWITLFLSALVFLIGRAAQVEIAWAKYQVAKAKTDAYLWSGLFFAFAQLKNIVPGEAVAGESSAGAKQRSQSSGSEEVWEIPLDTGYFRLGWSRMENDGRRGAATWFQDEADRINLNGLTASNYRILQELLIFLGVEDDVAWEIVRSVVDWQDGDRDLLGQKGKEDDFYMNQSRPYHCKNRPFDSLEEVLLVRGMSGEIWQKLLPFITVFPRNGELRVNFNTAPEAVLQALARYASGPKTNTDSSDANSLVQKMLDARKERLSPEGDSWQPIDFNNMKLNAKEKAIYLAVVSYKARSPEVVRFYVRGVEPNAHVETRGEFVVDLRKGDVLSWQRDSN